MINPHEIFILLVSTGVLMLTLILLKRLVIVPFWKLLLTAFLLYYASTILTILEGFFLPDLMNLLEHLCRAIFPGFVLLWCLALSRSRIKNGSPF